MTGFLGEWGFRPSGRCSDRYLALVAAELGPAHQEPATGSGHPLHRARRRPVDGAHRQPETAYVSRETADEAP